MMYSEEAGEAARKDLIAEIDEWKRRAQIAEQADNEELRVALAGHKKLMAERDALAVQNDALRDAIGCVLSYCKADFESHEDAESKGAVRNALALDLPRAAKIAEVRRKVCEAADEAHTCVHFPCPICVGLGELWEMESKNP